VGRVGRGRGREAIVPTDVFSVVFHYYVDEIVDGCCRNLLERFSSRCGTRLTVLVSYEYLAVEHLVVSEDVVEHFLVEILRWCRECDLHPPSFLRF
jgi:hypothetical protein